MEKKMSGLQRDVLVIGAVLVGILFFSLIFSGLGWWTGNSVYSGGENVLLDKDSGSTGVNTFNLNLNKDGPEQSLNLNIGDVANFYNNNGLLLNFKLLSLNGDTATVNFNGGVENIKLNEYNQIWVGGSYLYLNLNLDGNYLGKTIARYRFLSQPLNQNNIQELNINKLPVVADSGTSSSTLAVPLSTTKGKNVAETEKNTETTISPYFTIKNKDGNIVDKIPMEEGTTIIGPYGETSIKISNLNDGEGNTPSTYYTWMILTSPNTPIAMNQKVASPMNMNSPVADSKDVAKASSQKDVAPIEPPIKYLTLKKALNLNVKISRPYLFFGFNGCSVTSSSGGFKLAETDPYANEICSTLNGYKNAQLTETQFKNLNEALNDYKLNSNNKDIASEFLNYLNDAPSSLNDGLRYSL